VATLARDHEFTFLEIQLSDRRSLERDRAIGVGGTVEKESRPMGGSLA
jgi:hypothetical protein